RPRAKQMQPFDCGCERAFACGGDLVIAPLRPRLAERRALCFPARVNAAGMLEAAQRRVDGACRVAGHVDDLEPVPMAAGDGLQDQRGGERDSHFFTPRGAPRPALVRSRLRAREAADATLL